MTFERNYSLSRICRRILLLAILFPGCELREVELPTAGTTNTSTISNSPSAASGLSVPTAVSPAPGSAVAEGQPVLVVSNVTSTDGNIPTYAFTVATDSGFTAVVTRADNVPQGSNGQTSWRVSETLEPRRYFWQAQARVGDKYGPLSAVADFTVQSSPGQGGVLVSDPLTNRSSLGQVNGGEFTPQGWRINTKDDFIRYDVPPITSGYVEWDNIGLAPQNHYHDNYMLFGMWDPTLGHFRDNPFRVNIQKLDTNHNPPYVRLRWIANGEQHNGGHNFLNWDPAQTYHWRIEWGPIAGVRTARVLLNGQPIISMQYSRVYRPQTHWIELGIAARHESIVGAVYANVVIGSR